LIRDPFIFTMRLHLTVLAGASIALASWVAARAVHFPAPRKELVFKVEKFGAKCDGRTDDTAAVQRAIDAATAAGGGVVQFPSGVCLLNSCQPSSHPWYFYNLLIGSDITLRGADGAKLLQGPGGRHPLPDRAMEVGNSVLAFGLDYEVIRFQNPAYNGGFYPLEATTAGRFTVALAKSLDAAQFQAGDYVAIYRATNGDVIPTETSWLTMADAKTGVLRLSRPLARSFPTAFIAKVTKLATKNVGVENLIVEGAEPLSVTETFGFLARNDQFIIDSSIGGSNILNLQLNTLHDFQFIHNTFATAGPNPMAFELPQRNSQYGLFEDNTFNCRSAGFGEYAAHITLTNNHFHLQADPSVVAGIFIGGEDVQFVNNDVQGGNVTGGSGWGVILADYVGPAEYAGFVGHIRIANNRFDCRADGNACLGLFARDTAVTGNTLRLRGSARGIHAEGPLPQANLIQSNTIGTEAGEGMLIVTPAGGGGGSRIEGNTLSGGGVDGIRLETRGAPKAGGVVLRDNTIRGFKTALAIH
jgi:hypothetical protein